MNQYIDGYGKVFKTKTYAVTYSDSNGTDYLNGRYILEAEWLRKMITEGKAKIKLRS